jgi:hypothetical protein
MLRPRANSSSVTSIHLECHIKSIYLESFLAPSRRMVFDMHHPNHDLAGYHVENASGKLLFQWKMLDQ